MTPRKYFAQTGTVLLAVLFLFLSCSRGTGADPAAAEMERILGCEISAAEAREAMLLGDAVESGADGITDDVDARLEIILQRDDVVSFAIRRSSEELSPYGRVSYYNIDPDTGEHLTLADVLGEDYRSLVMAAIDKRLGEDGELAEALFAIDLAPLVHEGRPFYVTEDGVTVVFDVGEIAEEAVGAVEIAVIG